MTATRAHCDGFEGFPENPQCETCKRRMSPDTFNPADDGQDMVVPQDEPCNNYYPSHIHWPRTEEWKE